MEATNAVREILGKKTPVKRSPEPEEMEGEMQECLKRLEVWQTENLMAPHGMDRFTEKH